VIKVTDKAVQNVYNEGTRSKKGEGIKMVTGLELRKIELRQNLKPGDTVYTILRHVSQSGMSRSIDLLIIKDNRHWIISPLAAEILGMGLDHKHGGIKISGCGMDMGFELVYNLGRDLYPDGYKVEGRGRNGDESGWDKDGGYALKREWI
jgi:hypothetical protein